MAMAFVTLLTFIVFGYNITFNYIIFDVPKVIFENPHIMSGLTPENIYWTFTTPNFGLYQPLPNLSFMIDSDLFGSWPGGFHTMTLVWHIVCMCLFFWVMLQLTGNFAAVFAATLLMSIHPVQILTVSQIATRHEIMETVFMLLSIEAYRRYVVHKSRRAYCFSLFFMCLGMLCKQIIFMLPILLLMLDYWPLDRVALSFRSPLETLRAVLRLMLEKTPYFVLSVIAVVLAIVGKSQFKLVEAGIKRLSLSESGYIAVTGYARYIGHLVYPIRIGYFTVAGEQPSFTFFMLSAFLFILLTTLALALLWKRPYIGVGWFWFVFYMLPASGVLRYGIESIALRYMYISAMGLYLAFCIGLYDFSVWLQQRISKKPKNTPPIWYWMTIGALTITLFGLTFWQHGFFRDTENMAKRVLAITDDRSVFGHIMLGFIREDQRLYEEANFHFRKCIEIEPEYVLFRYYYADSLMRENRFQEAIDVATEALEKDPDHTDFLVLSGVAKMNLKRFEEAETDLRRAVEVEPDNTKALHNLSYTLALLGDFAQARELNKQVLLLEPDNYLAKTLAEQLNWSIPSPEVNESRETAP